MFPCNQRARSLRAPGPVGLSSLGGGAAGGLRLAAIDRVKLLAAELAVAVLVGLVEAFHQALVAGGFGLAHGAIAIDVGVLEGLLEVDAAGAGGALGARRRARAAARLVLRLALHRVARRRAAGGRNVGLRMRHRALLVLLHGIG